MKLNKALTLSAIALLLNACTVADQAMLNPEGNYVNGKSVSQLSATDAVTIVGSKVGENGNHFPAYLSLLGTSTYHKKVRFSPTNQTVFVKCFKQHFTSSVAGPTRTTYKHTQQGHGIASVKGGFVLGKTYQVSCNKTSGKTYQVVTKAVDGDISFDNTATPTTQKPNDNNRVTFVVTGKSLDSFLTRLVSNTAMAIRNWDGQLVSKAELAAPLNRIFVSCRVGGEALNVSVQGNFEAGKTYRLACKRDKGVVSAYVAETY